MILEKVNKKAEEDIKEINAAYQELYNNVILSSLKNTHINYYNYISSIISKSRQNNDIYKINYKIDELAQDNNNLNYKNSEYSENNENSNNIINDEVFNNNDSYNGKLENKENNEMLIIKKDFNQIEKDMSKSVRKFKKELRKIKRLKDLYEMLDEVNKDNSNKTCLSKAWNYFKYFMYCYSLIVIIIIEYGILKISSERADEYERKIRKLEEKASIVLIVLFTIFNSSYTIAIIYSIYKRNIISKDLIFKKHCGDNLNLIETIKTISGIAFPLAYCNLFSYYMILGDDILKKPFLYDTVKFPLYYIREKIDSQALIKYLLTLISIILSFFFGKICFYTINDFGSIKKIWTYNHD